MCDEPSPFLLRGALFYSDVAKRWCFPNPGPDKSVVSHSKAVSCGMCIHADNTLQVYRSQRYRYENEGISTVSVEPSLSISVTVSIHNCSTSFVCSLVCGHFGMPLAWQSSL